MRNKLKLIKGHLSILFLVVLSSCGSGEEGCLDISATNFDASVDVSCNNCCTYPTLSFRVNHVYDSVNFSLNQVYHDANNTPYTVTGAQFYTSDLNLIKSDGSTVGVTDKLTLVYFDNSSQSVEDNFTLIEKSIGAYSKEDIGSITTTGDFTKIRFYVGVSELANHAEPSQMPTDHALASQSDTMHWNATDGYIFNKITVQNDTSSTNTTKYEVGMDGNLVLVELDYPQTIQSGYDVDIIIQLDYFKLFDTIGFQTDDAATIKSKIVSNTADAFSVVN